MELPRQPGSRENRWMHLLSGAPVQSSSAVGFAAEPPSLAISELAAVKANELRWAPSPLVGEGWGERASSHETRALTPHPARFARHPLPQGERVRRVLAPCRVVTLSCDSEY
jgi:hypothetical protein